MEQQKAHDVTTSGFIGKHRVQGWGLTEGSLAGMKSMETSISVLGKGKENGNYSCK